MFGCSSAGYLVAPAGEKRRDRGSQATVRSTRTGRRSPAAWPPRDGRISPRHAHAHRRRIVSNAGRHVSRSPPPSHHWSSSTGRRCPRTPLCRRRVETKSEFVRPRRGDAGGAARRAAPRGLRRRSGAGADGRARPRCWARRRARTVVTVAATARRAARRSSSSSSRSSTTATVLLGKPPDGAVAAVVSPSRSAPSVGG